METSCLCRENREGRLQQEWTSVIRGSVSEILDDSQELMLAGVSCDIRPYQLILIWSGLPWPTNNLSHWFTAMSGAALPKKYSPQACFSETHQSINHLINYYNNNNQILDRNLSIWKYHTHIGLPKISLSPRVVKGQEMLPIIFKYHRDHTVKERRQ